MHITKHLDSDKQHLNGREVVVERVVTEETMTEADRAEFDVEALPMVYVRTVDTNEQLVVWPEELSEPVL